MRRLLLALLLLGIVGFLATVTVTTLLASEWGRRFVRDKLNAGVSGQIAGRLEVAEIESLSFSRVRVRGVRILAPDGKPAIEADRADIRFELSQLFSKRYGWERAEIEGCLVHVTEDDDGRINMEETFKARDAKPDGASESESESELDLRTMVTSRCTLLIGGGTLPDLRMTDLEGIMRVHVLKNGETQLRFDAYRGTFTDGLPTGVLAFRDVAGHVHTGEKRLLLFRGSGTSKGEPVAFELDIHTEPKRKVKIDALFPDLSLASLSTTGVAVFSKFSPTLDLTVRHGKED